MDWKAALGILLLPLLAAAAWMVFARSTLSIAPPEEGAPFEQEGNMIQGNPGLDTGTWHLVYEEPGAPGLTVPLRFNSESRCGSEAYLKVCDISFAQGQRVKVTGFIEDGIVYVRELLYGD